MTTAVKAIYEHGVFMPVAPVLLKGSTEVEVLVPTDASADEDDPTGWKAVEGLIGIVKDAPPEMAENHDRYLYDWPRK
jgi:predicted DNA-binding antitoxin AbrB/MazE fold protein